MRSGIQSVKLSGNLPQGEIVQKVGIPEFLSFYTPPAKPRELKHVSDLDLGSIPTASESDLESIRELIAGKVYDSALAYIESLIPPTDKKLEFMLSKALCHRELGDFNKAINMLLQAENEFPNKSEVMSAYVDTYYAWRDSLLRKSGMLPDNSRRQTIKGEKLLESIEHRNKGDFVAARAKLAEQDQRYRDDPVVKFALAKYFEALLTQSQPQPPRCTA